MSVRPRSILASVATALLVVAVADTPASAHTGGPPYLSTCVPSDGIVESCFESEGDDFWVRDNEADGKSAAVKWRTDYGRTGKCINSHGSGTWHECMFDMAEGHLVEWDHYTYDSDTGTWDLISSGYADVI